MDKQLFNEKVEKIIKKLSVLNMDDKKTIITIGASVEKLINDMPQDLSFAKEIFMLILQSLQAIYQGTINNERICCDTIMECLNSINSMDDSQIAKSKQSLEKILNSPTPPLDNEDKKIAEENLSMDDIAAKLVLINSNDKSNFLHIKNSLNTLIKSSSFSSDAVEELTGAILKLDEIIEKNPADITGILADIGKFIENAQNINDQSTGVACSVQPKIEQKVESNNSNAPKVFKLPDDADRTLIGEFINESREYIEGAESALLTLETNPQDKEAINVVFRGFHTIKGTSAFLGFNFITDLAHDAESLLSKIRDNEIQYNTKYADIALRSIDMLKELFQCVQNALGGVITNISPEYDNLMAVLADPLKTSSPLTKVNKVEFDSNRLGDILVKDGKATREEIEAAADCQGNKKIGEAIVKANIASVTDVAESIRQQKVTNDDSNTFVKVRTDRVDKLLDMVGELVIAHSMIAQDTTLSSQHDLSKKISQTSKIVRELQDLSMTIRMVPLKATFQKMNRLVRDLAHKSNKCVNFITEGEDTEIDRNMVDIINDPLVHLIRNSVDHGIEDADTRIKQDKPKEGTIRLKAYNSSGNVVVEIQDDGKGINREKVVEKAISKGLINSDKNLSNSEIYKLIFLPGFSTADKVTDISGRGVGLDVVKKNVDRLKGHIDITSEKNKGTIFSIKLPLTLAITDGMLVKVGNERYIIPTINICNSFVPKPGSLSTVANRGELVINRGELLPIFRLHQLFQIDGAIKNPIDGLLMIITDGDERFALLVDELLGQQQVVTKSLNEGVGKVQGVSGAAILGNGCVGLILDPHGLSMIARERSNMN